ncbi:hypothetical protein [uncultured Clostridium sp.]|uniref:hypothetical protein n=1 Tax=uncultured Clostridium sp. TaxID=59620 RepID=UPI0025D4C2A9|nr:hypothetical protein [uncultured Clostridium sp.]
MKELAILISNIEKINLIDEYDNYKYEAKNHLTLWLNKAFEIIQKKIKDIPLTRVYFGNEFCERRIPTIDEMEKILAVCREKNLKLTLLTSYCSNSGVDKIKKILDKFEQDEYFDEVVVNDWGVLNLLKNKKSIKVVFGRVMDKMKRDPRVGQKDFIKLFNGEGLKMLRSPSASEHSYQKFLKENQVSRIEIDNVQQGLYLDDINDFDISVYLPFGFVTNGKICQFAGIHNEVKDKFKVTTPCRRECKELTQLMHKNISAIPDQLPADEVGRINLIRKGNTIFYLNEVIDDVVENKRINRIIYEPTVPM